MPGLVSRRGLLTGLAALLLAPPDLLEPRRKLWALGGLPRPRGAMQFTGLGTFSISNVAGGPAEWYLVLSPAQGERLVLASQRLLRISTLDGVRVIRNIPIPFDRLSL